MNVATGPGSSNVEVPRRSTSRALGPDLARGAMLLLIALANTPTVIWKPPYAGGTLQPPYGSLLDRVVQFVLITTVEMRVYPMFAFLFGYGMVQFARSRTAKGFSNRQVWWMLQRRHFGLLLLGLLHASLLFSGDILGSYGVIGFLLVAGYFRRKDRTLKVWRALWLGCVGLLAALSLLGGAALLVQGTEVPMREGVGASKAVYAATSWLGSLPQRLIGWVTATLFPVLLLPTIPAAIVAGWLAARRSIIDEPERHLPWLRRTATVGLAVGWLGGLPSALFHVGLLPVPASLWWMLLTWHMFSGFFAGVGYVALFGLLAVRLKNRPFGMLTSAVTAVGRRSLSCYLFQAMVFVPLLAAWGLGLGGWWGSAPVALLAVLIWSLSAGLALLFERRGWRGPLEIPLRWLTAGRARPAG